MNLFRKQSVPRWICSAVFLTVVFVFLVRYGLIYFGWVENQVSTKDIGGIPEQASEVQSRSMEGSTSSLTRSFQRVQAALNRFEVAARGVTARIDDFARQNALFRIPFSELNMGFRKAAGMRLFPDADRTLRLNNGHLIQTLDRIDVDAAARPVIEFRQRCANRGLPFLYVVLPTKACRVDNQLPWGMEDHCIENSDRFMAQIAAGGVPILDLHGQAQTSFPDYFDLFFRTDHHWKPETGLWAAGQIAAELNRRLDFGLPVESLAGSNFNVQVFPRFFLGSLGKKLTRAYATPDDFSLVTPKFETALTGRMSHRSAVRSGDFRKVWIDERQIAQRNYYQRNPYGAYAFSDPPQMSVTNHLHPNGKRLLIVKDSYANVVAPFLSLVSARVDMLDLRDFDGSVADYIERSRPDVVLILYSAGFIRHAASTSEDGNPFRFD